MDDELVYVGKIIDLQPIEGADFIVSATVICGKGGKWKGIVRKADFSLEDLCLVYLPDALIPESDDMKFMAASDWRVKMRRFKGVPSEVLIMPLGIWKLTQTCVGFNMTQLCNVIKYHKPIPAHLNGIAIGYFPNFIPKTDEPNYQSEEGERYLQLLEKQPYYITEKCDGSSTTAYKYNGHFGVCSRNLELERNPENGYWKVALKYSLEENLPEGYALQWETCGPGIQSNPMGLDEIDGFAFSAYLIPEHRYLEFGEFISFCKKLGFPKCEVIEIDDSFEPIDITRNGEGCYSNGKPREGVIIRSKANMLPGKPVSFKVINLDYEK